MAKQIKELFDGELSHLKIDNGLIRTITDLRTEFMNRNEDHLLFFSGNLIGVNQIKYKESDRENWFDLVLEHDEHDIKPKLKEIKAIDPSWIRLNDVVNLSSIYLLHAIYNSKLSPRKKEEAMIEVCMLLQYKFLSSILSHYFRFRSDPDISRATYEALSRKFDLKREGSWQGLLEKRSRDIIDRNGIHFKTYSQMNDDQKVLNMITDIQDRLRNVVKNLKDTFDRVRSQNLKIASTSTMVYFDGEKEILAQTRDQTAYTRYIKDIVTDHNTFVRDELVEVVVDLLHTVNKNFFLDSLSYFSDNFGKGGDKNIEKLIDETLSHAYKYLSDNVGTMSSGSDIGELIVKLKNLYLASRMSDPQLIEMKKLAHKVVSKSVKTRNDAALASVRTALQLYIVIRAFSKKYYQG